MSKMKHLLAVIDDMRSLADSLQTLAEAIASNEPQEHPMPGKEHPQPPQRPKTISLEDVRAVLAVKSQQGFTSEVRDLIQQYGAAKLSEIDAEHYEAILKAAEELGNE